MFEQARGGEGGGRGEGGLKWKQDQRTKEKSLFEPDGSRLLQLPIRANEQPRFRCAAASL